MGLFSPQISLKKVVPLCRQLATSYDAGIPIIRGLEIVGRQNGDKRIREVTTQMGESIKHGSTLGEAARAQKRYLPTFFIELLASGEQGGKLDVMFRDLAQYFEDRLEMQRRIVRSLIYPFIQLAALWYVGMFALRLLPKLQEMFKSDGRSNFDLFTYFQEYAIFQAKSTLVFAAIFAGCVILSRMGLFGYVWGLVATHVWPLSPVTRRFGLARFFRSMSLLIGSGMRVDHCIVSSAAVTANPYMQKDLIKAVPLVRAGHTLVESFETSKYLTPTAREMLSVGEQSGQLEASLKKVSDYHMEEAQHAVAIATRVMGVAILLLVAGLIGYVIISFYMGYFSMMGDILDGI
ncbi:MAG: type II secretion system F family protein [Candidatus Hydrogenedentes bacterium]|nr:type II secretion system F family protein [Candidatus Hydrogenedentota bacterium]